MNSMKLDLANAFKNIGFDNFDDFTSLGTIDDLFTYYKYSEKLPSHTGFGFDQSTWMFGTIEPHNEKPVIEFVSITLEKDIPEDIGIQMSLEKNWLMPPFPMKEEMIRQIHASEAKLIFQYQTLKSNIQTSLRIVEKQQFSASQQKKSNGSL